MVHLENVTKKYQTKHNVVNALDGIELRVEKDEFAVIRGSSGSGKTTLLMAIGGMLRPSSGVVSINGKNIYALNERNRANFRAENIGFVFQMFHLLPYLNTIENVLLPAGVGKIRGNKNDVMDMLKRLRLSDRAYHKPSELSAGERQRTAIARALLNQPELILADEPTGNLDPENAEEVIRYLAEFCRNGGTVIIVTHGTEAIRYADRIIHLKTGRIER